MDNSYRVVEFFFLTPVPPILRALQRYERFGSIVGTGGQVCRRHNPYLALCELPCARYGLYI